ncbi:MAG: peptidase M14 [Planctomycetes bacterium]|nr:peptidase M14 [Planctomycetota bacterium]
MKRSRSRALLLLLPLLPAPASAWAADVPAPESVLGFAVGADAKLADWELMQRYFRALDEASARVAVEVIGQSTEGRPILLAAISSAENLARRDALRQALRQLADPRAVSAAQAERLIAETPVALFVGCAQHATEIGATQMALRLAHRLATEETPEMERIRREVVLLLVPSMNPDGHQMVCDWYAAQLGTPFEGGRMPWLYHKYVGHDNNRDWAMITQAESRHISRVLYQEWLPQIVIDVHQMGSNGARMFIPPYYDPINPNIDPLIDHELTLLCAQMRLDLSAAGLKGVISNALFDEWLLGYFTSVPSRHNMVSLLIELASVNVASPVFLRQRELRGSSGSENARRANFPEPWEGGWWRLEDIVDYEETALLSALSLAARSRDLFLRNFHSLAAKQVEAGRSEPPFAFLVPARQEDRATAWKMLAALMRGGVEVHEAAQVFSADGVEYPAGTRVVLMAQPYRAHAKDLLEQQVYPDLRSGPDGALERPYDVTGWTLPLLMGVDCVEVVHPFTAELRPLARGEEPPPGEIADLTPESRHLLIERTQNDAFRLVNRVLARGGLVRVLDDEGAGAKRTFPAGTFLLPLEGEGDPLLEEVRGLGLSACALAEDPWPGYELQKPARLGLYQPWTASMDEGWTRWVLEQSEFPYRSLHDAEIRAGGLRERYDVIVLPDLEGASIIRGVSPGGLPKPYTGGIGEEGVFALRDFARDGGTLVALDSSCPFLIEALELPLRRVPPGEKDGKRFLCPGSILRCNFDTEDPLAYGMQQAAPVMFTDSTVMEEKTPKRKKDEEQEDEQPARPEFVGRYPRMNPLMSGWIENDEVIRGKGALVEAEFGSGRAVLIGFRCQFRAQAHGTFRILFNAILSAAQEPEPPAGK